MASRRGAKIVYCETSAHQIIQKTYVMIGMKTIIALFVICRLCNYVV